MNAISQDLAKTVFDHLPKPIKEWWQPLRGTDEETQSRLHLARMHFIRVIMRIHAQPGHGLYPRTHPGGHLQIPIRLDRERRALGRLREVEHLQIALPPEPLAADALREKIFLYPLQRRLPYMYRTLLHEIDEPLFCYPALLARFPRRNSIQPL
jgi:hypothetical protein